MKRLKPLLLILFMLLMSKSMYCGTFDSPDISSASSLSSPTSALPSDQTYSEIQASSGVPNLRYGPGEGGDANKESPLSAGDTNYILLSLFVLGAVCTSSLKRVYTTYTHRNTSNELNTNK